MSCLGFQENINKVAKDEDINNMQIEEEIKKDEDTNIESAEVIQEESTMEDTENMHIDEVITVQEDTYPESTEASFLSTCHYYSNSNTKEHFVIFLVEYHIKKICYLL